MLKIKDDVDLKELEKFGYTLKDDNDNYYIKRNEKYRIQINVFDRKILVYKYRENSDWGTYIGYLDKEENELKEYIQDLNQAGLVEKVEG